MSDQPAREGTTVPFRASVTRMGEVARVELAGDLDMATSDALGDTLATAVSFPGTRRIVVHLAEVTFLASSGISALLSAYRGARHRQARLTVINARPIVARVLELTGVDKLLAPDDSP